MMQSHCQLSIKKYKVSSKIGYGLVVIQIWHPSMDYVARDEDRWFEWASQMIIKNKDLLFFVNLFSNELR